MKTAKIEKLTEIMIVVAMIALLVMTIVVGALEISEAKFKKELQRIEQECRTKHKVNK